MGDEVLRSSYEDLILASRPFVFSKAPDRVAHVGHPVRRIVRYNEERKQQIFKSDERKRRYQESLKAQRLLDKLTKCDQLPNQSASPAASANPIDAAEIGRIVKTFATYTQTDAEMEQLIRLTRQYLEGDANGVRSFRQFTKMLKSRA